MATEKGGEYVGIHKGTKLTETPKETVIRARIDSQTVEKLKTLCDVKKKSKSEIIREGIDQLYREIK